MVAFLKTDRDLKVIVVFLAANIYSYQRIWVETILVSPDFTVQSLHAQLELPSFSACSCANKVVNGNEARNFLVITPHPASPASFSQKPNELVALKMEGGSRAMWFVKRRTMLFSINKHQPPDDHYFPLYCSSFSRFSAPNKVTQVEGCIFITLEEITELWGHLGVLHRTP